MFAPVVTATAAGDCAKIVWRRCSANSALLARPFRLLSPFLELRGSCLQLLGLRLQLSRLIMQITLLDSSSVRAWRAAASAASSCRRARSSVLRERLGPRAAARSIR